MKFPEVCRLLLVSLVQVVLGCVLGEVKAREASHPLSGLRCFALRCAPELSRLIAPVRSLLACTQLAHEHLEVLVNVARLDHLQGHQVRPGSHFVKFHLFEQGAKLNIQTFICHVELGIQSRSAKIRHSAHAPTNCTAMS